MQLQLADDTNGTTPHRGTTPHQPTAAVIPPIVKVVLEIIIVKVPLDTTLRHATPTDLAGDFYIHEEHC
jgi:hypothetical protein